MDTKVAPPIPRIAPLSVDANPELSDIFDAARKRMGYVPNSDLIMQRKPKVLKAFAALSAAVNDPESTVPRGLKRLIGHVTSRAAGCQYCMAHTAELAHKQGIDDRKLAAVWSYQTDPLFTLAERAALDVAVAAGTVPNAVTDEMFLELKKYWTEEQIVEIVAVIALIGFHNRFNDTMATPLEDEPTHFANSHLAQHGWKVGKHAR
jgi:uncharacterized peroxidase-related enzyme